MPTLDQPFYMIRVIGGSDQFMAGHGTSGTPKLYTKGTAASVVGRLNKQAAIYNKQAEYEVVPVVVTLLP
jgi:hypothetical protein